MADSYETYQDELTRLLTPLAPREQYFFGCWCVEKLLGIFLVERVKKISEAERALVSQAMAFMWISHTNFTNIDQEELQNVFTAIQKIEEKKFNQNKFPEYCAKGLLTAQLLMLAFLEEQASDLVTDTAETVLQVMEFTIAHNFGHDTTDLFNHPLISQEWHLQQRLIECLGSGHSLTADDKRLFRE